MYMFLCSVCRDPPGSRHGRNSLDITHDMTFVWAIKAFKPDDCIPLKSNVMQPNSPISEWHAASNTLSRFDRRLRVHTVDVCDA